MSLPFDLQHSYAESVPALSVDWKAAVPPQARVVLLNDELVTELGGDVEALHGDKAAQFLAGVVPDGVRTTAQAYCGHQFGSFSGTLGDGRALLLGEVTTPQGTLVDLHLKGSGRTPFSRAGDGKAALGPMLREYVMGEAMHALGIPTTRALSVVSTGETVLRDDPLPGAVLCRVAASHIRVGTFEYAALTNDVGILRSLVNYTIDRHYPAAAEAPKPALALLNQVVQAQARTIAQWMSVGFIHGVMNTDNMALSGETMDYGPCAFMDIYDAATVFSSIDRGGRYAYGNQPAIAVWNLARFAETLLPLIDDNPADAVTSAQDALHEFHDLYQDHFVTAMSQKLGMDSESEVVVTDCLELLHRHRIDFTLFFRTLAHGRAESLFDDAAEFLAWNERRCALVSDPVEARSRMLRTNPAYIPRLHRVEEALDAATEGDLQPFHRLLGAVGRPFDECAELADLMAGPPLGAPRGVTYCGT